jgi:spoIIIJ-associated protein
VARPADYQPRRSERRQPSPEQAEQLKKDIEKMLELMGTTMEVEMKQHAGNLVYNLKGEKEGLLIGKRGMTLEALQEVVADMAATLAGDKSVYAVVDIADYRTRQESKFMDQARELAQKALAGEGQQSMGPLSPAERRVVHLALQSMEGVETFSVGEGARKKVMIQKKA